MLSAVNEKMKPSVQKKNPDCIVSRAALVIESNGKVEA